MIAKQHKSVAVLCKGCLEEFPPVMTVAWILRELGMDVRVLCSQSTDSTKADYAAKGIAVADVYPDFPSGSLRAKASHWRRFSVGIWQTIDKEGDPDLLWVGSVDGALALGKRLLGRRFVLHAMELYDTKWLYRRLMRRYVKRAAAVVVPEYCRATIYRVWYQLPRTPFVVPNKPWSHPRRKRLPLSANLTGDVVERIQSAGKRLVLYQGHMSWDRDIRALASVVHESGNMQFAVMGRDRGLLPAIREACPSVICIPYVAAPAHLAVTSYADVGALCYSHTSLNNLFCAPNKIWEYSGFGIPMICNDVPALEMAMSSSGAGCCAPFEEADAIRRSLRKIFDQYDTYQEAAQRFYESVDMKERIEEVLAHCGIARREND